VIYTAAPEDLWNPHEPDAAMEKGFQTPFTIKALLGASWKKGVSNPFSLSAKDSKLCQNPDL